MKIKLPLYKYNKENLQYQQIFLLPKALLKILGYQIITSIILISILSFGFNTPKEFKLKRELKNLKHEFYLIDRKTDQVIYLLDILEKKDSVIYQSLFLEPDTPENKFKSGYITEGDGKFYDTITHIGNKLSLIEMKLEKTNYRFRKLISDISKNEDRLKHTPAIQPISNRNLNYTSSGYGLRTHPIYKIKKMHHGMDFVAPVGTPIYATADGVVQVSSPSFHGYGKYIKIDHGYGYKTIYAHLNSLNVKRGQQVKRGEIIGTLGNTGISTGPHLHYEVIVNGKTVDPINHYYHDLSADEYEEMLRIANSFDKSLD